MLNPSKTNLFLLILVIAVFLPGYLNAETHKSKEREMVFEEELVKGDLYGPKGALIKAGNRGKKRKLFKAPKSFKKRNKALKESLE